ncbi:MAG: hypothetical protein ACLPHP_04095 [Candidatus Sulfotelmatobacter sp.]
MPELGDVLEIGLVLAAFERRLAAINANWNGQGPDLMTPAQLKAFMSDALSLQQECGNLLLAVGQYSGRIGIGEIAA